MAGRSFIGGGAYLSVDMSDLQQKISMMRGVLDQKQFQRLMYRTFGETAKKSKTLVAREVVKDYAVTQQWVRSHIGGYRLGFSGLSGVTCTIPLSGEKGSIGGRFEARRPATMARTGMVYASIVRGRTSRMPRIMERQGGHPPFMANGVAFTRRTKERLPIVSVVGLGVPQMPLNLSEDKVTDSLLKYTDERLEHNFMYMFGGK